MKKYLPEQITIANEIENTYNKGLTIGESIKIVNPDAFSADENGKITGHIYNLCAFGRNSEIEDMRFKKAIINALVKRGVEVFMWGGFSFIRDTNRHFHELYANYGMIWEKRDSRGIQVFADSAFGYYFRIRNDSENELDAFYSHEEEPRFVIKKVLEMI